MSEFFLAWLTEIWNIIVDSAPYFILGLLMAGLISAFVNRDTLVRLVGKGLPSVFRASLIGVPLQLCSCSTLPVAAQLRKGGLGKPAVASFLISTPETSADSIILTYALTDPLLTVARPVSAFVTAVVAGSLEQMVGGSESEAEAKSRESAPVDCGCEGAPKETKPSALARIGNGARYAATDLMADLAPYLLIGFILAGLVAAVLQVNESNLIHEYGSGWVAYLAALVVGLPLYVCATSTTPLAAVLLGSGFSPGAILVFLLVGPATNLASLAVLNKILGRSALLRYLLTLVVISVVCGFLCDLLYGVFGIVPHYSPGDLHQHTGSLSLVAAIVLCVLVIWHCLLKLSRRLARA